MNKKPFNPAKFLAFSMLVCGSLAVPSSATIIMVYTKNGTKDSMEEMKSAAALLRQELNNPATSLGNGQPSFPNDKFGYVISNNSSVLNKDFSVAPGVSAYFWSDGPVKAEKGFEVRGGPVAFERARVQVAKKDDGGVKKANLIAKNSLSHVVMNGRFIHLDYVMSKPGSITLQIFGMNGRSLGRWNWEDMASGTHVKDVELGSIPKNSMLFVRWGSGNAHSVQKVVVDQAKEP